MTPDQRPRVVAVVGPTATGKTALSIYLARRFSGEVINADSRLFYRGLDIGTAKPTPEEMRGVPHHLVDFLEPSARFGLTEFIDSARVLISAMDGRGRLPLLVGGTGQYVWGLLEGWNVPRVPPDPELRAELESRAASEGPAPVVEMLRDLDPGAAERVDQRNARRVIRAIEVARATHGHQRQPARAETPPFRNLIIGLHLEREDLYPRLDARMDGMLMAGWVEEVKQLLESGIPLTAPAMTSTGYRDIAAYLSGEITLGEATARARKATRYLVRHQYNWFRLSDPRISWIPAQPADAAAEQAERLVRTWLAEPPDTIKSS